MTLGKGSHSIANLEALDTFARRAILRWKPKSIILLKGDLGAGKTTLVRSVVRALGGAQAVVRSPSFTIHQSYPEVGVEHFDLYRFERVRWGDLIEIGFIEVSERVERFCFIEWPERVEHVEWLSPTVVIDLTLEADGGRVLSEESYSPPHETR